MHPHCRRSHPTAGCPWLIKMNNMPGELTTDRNAWNILACRSTGANLIQIMLHVVDVRVHQSHKLHTSRSLLHVFSHRFADNLGITSSARPTYFFQWSKPDSALRFGLRVVKNAAPKTARNRTQRNSVGILEYYFISVYIMWQTQHYSLHQPQFYQKYIDWLWLKSDVNLLHLLWQLRRRKGPSCQYSCLITRPMAIMAIDLVDAHMVRCK